MQLKRLVFSLLVVILILSATSVAVFAAEPATFDIAVETTSTADAEGDLLVKPGDRIDVSITITNNPGVSMLEFVVAYDSEALTLNGTPEGYIYNFTNGKITHDVNAGTIRFVSDMGATANLTAEGVVAKLSFTVKKSFHGDSAVSLTRVNAINKDWSVVEYTSDALDFSCHTLGEAVVTEPACGVEGNTTQKCTVEGCDYAVVTDVKPALEHKPVVVPAVEPTCTNVGLTEGQKCEVCNEILVKQEEIVKLPHTSKSVEGKAATCTEAGLTTGIVCSVCDTVIEAQTEIPALGHTEVEDAAVAPTCTEAGKTAGKHCSVCNEVLVAQETVAALGHTEVEDAAVAPTCTEAGKTAGKHCSVCNEVLVAQEVVPALGHKVEMIPAVAPTCTEAGSTAGVKCSVCGEVLTAPEVVNALGHTDVEIPAVAATCTEAGKTAGTKCAVCGVITKKQEAVEAKGHTYGEWTVTKESTKKEVGEEARTCSVCGDVETRTIPVVEGGCKSSVAGISATVCAIVAFGATLIRKKKED